MSRPTRQDIEEEMCTHIVLHQVVPQAALELSSVLHKGSRQDETTAFAWVTPWKQICFPTLNQSRSPSLTNAPKSGYSKKKTATISHACEQRWPS